MKVKNDLGEVRRYLLRNLKSHNSAVNLRHTIRSFKCLMEDLLRGYSGVTIPPYKVSQDVLERFFQNMALGMRMRTRSSPEIMELVERLRNFQLSSWCGGSRPEDNFPVNEMSERMKLEAGPEEEFVPYDLDGEVFSDLTLNRLSKNEEDHQRLLTG